MAEVTAQPGGGAAITISPQETAGLKALAAARLPFLERAGKWFEADVAPELAQAAAFLKALAASPPEGSTLTVTPAEMSTLTGLLAAHLPDFKAVLAVVESPAVRALLTLAEALL